MNEKQKKKVLRELAGIALRRELELGLDALGKQFEKFRQGSLDAFSLDESVRHYAKKESPRAYYAYQTGAWRALVIRAVAGGLLLKKEIPPEILEDIKTGVEILSEKPKGAGKTEKTPKAVYRIKVTLQEVAPPVWRRLLADPAMNLHQFHEALQVVMGWTHSHLYEFRLGKERIGVPDPEFGGDIQSARKVKLGEVLREEGDKLVYLYDMGDGWEHEVVLEKILPPEEGKKPPVCLEGERACPPEDCGGPPGYENLLQAVRDPKHPEHKDLTAWLDGPFDPEKFNLEEVNKEL
jgi:hypothetical protein